MVEDFYAGLGRGLPVAEALREAKVAAIHRGAPAGEWAAFTVVGDPLVRVPLRESAPRFGKWLIAGAGALLLLAGYFVVRRRGRMSERTVRASDVVARTHHL